MPLQSRLLLGLAVALCLVAPTEATAQRHGRELPGLDIQHGWRARTQPRLEAQTLPTAQRVARVANLSPVKGTLRLPLLMVQFSDLGLGPTKPATIADQVAGSPTGMMSAREYYEQMSGGLLKIEAEHPVLPIQLPRPSAHYVGNRGETLVAEHLDTFLSDVISRAFDRFDWTKFDNDGPDGIPNSGDDDGRVDALVIYYASEDGSCSEANNGRMWAHRWNLTAALGHPLETASIGKNGKKILIDDYIAVPVYDCGKEASRGLAPNGTLIHELGHVLGLPDLYPTAGGPGVGVGRWDLMGSGNWYSQEYPMAMGAWSRLALGWAKEVVVEDAPDHRIAPVHDSRIVYRVPAATSDDYLLLEYRTATKKADATIPGEGLLIWQVDPKAVAENLKTNTVNANPSRPGIAVVQADGRSDLQRGTNDGDATDLWPQATATRFAHDTQPAAVSLADNKSLGIRLDRIRVEKGAIALDITHGLNLATRFTVDAGIAGVKATINDTLKVTLPYTALFATGSTVSVSIDTAASGGTRIRLDGWDDHGTGASRKITLPTRSEVRLQARVTREHQLQIATADTLLGSVTVRVGGGISESSGWIAEGADVTIRAHPSAKADRFLFWDADPKVHPDQRRFALEGTAITRKMTAPLHLTAVFTPPLPKGVSIDQALTVSPERVPEPLRRYLDVLGNRNGRFDIGDIVRALSEGRLRIGADGIQTVETAATPGGNP